MLFEAFFLRDGFHIADCTADTLWVEYVVYLGGVATGAVWDQVWVSLLEPGVANAETIRYGEFAKNKETNKNFKGPNEVFDFTKWKSVPQFYFQ